MNLLDQFGRRKTHWLLYAWDAVRLAVRSESTRIRRVDYAILGVENPNVFED